MKTFDTRALMIKTTIEDIVGNVEVYNVYESQDSIYLLTSELIPFKLLEAISDKMGKKIFVYKKEKNPIKLIYIYFNKIFGSNPIMIVENNNGDVKIKIGRVTKDFKSKFDALKKFLIEDYGIKLETFENIEVV